MKRSVKTEAVRRLARKVGFKDTEKAAEKKPDKRQGQRERLDRILRSRRAGDAWHEQTRRSLENAVKVRRSEARAKVSEARARFAELRADAKVRASAARAKASDTRASVSAAKAKASAAKYRALKKRRARRVYPNLFLGVVYDILAVANFLNGAKKKRWTSHAAGMLLMAISAFHFFLDFSQRKAE